MAKRTATSDLNHDNWNAEDETEDPGTFRRVSKEELKNRVIRKAKRSFNSNTSGTSSISASSPFAAFSGFTASSSPFTLSKKSENSISGQSILNSNKESNFTAKNGGSDGQSNKSENPTNSSSNTIKSSRSIEYYRQLQNLNESVLKWMQLHLAKNSCCDFTPVFNDYKKHMDRLNITYPAQKKDEIEMKTDNSTSSVVSKEVSKPMDTEFLNSTANSAESKLEKKLSQDETDYGAHFSAGTTNTSTFSFGCKATATATSSVTPSGPTSSSKEGKKTEKPFQFTFGTPSASNSEFSKGFSFASAIAGAKNTEGAAPAEEENYEPPKNDFVAVAEEDALYSKKCKLFFKKEDSFVDKGVGMLYLKSLEGKTQLLVRADTNLGNILLNIMLSASLPMSRTGKNNVLIVCVPNPPIDAKKPDCKEAIPMLIRVKTAEDADELLENMNKHKS